MQDFVTQVRTEASGGTSRDTLADYPIREYVAAMAAELATMARWDGDEALASILDLASAKAMQRPVTPIPAPQAAVSLARPD